MTLNWPDRKIILDCKFYREALVSREGRHRLHSGHLYQLNAYLQNQSRHPGWENVEGVLLYPANQHHLDHSFTLLGHRIRVLSIDLDQPWMAIHKRVFDVLNCGAGNIRENIGKEILTMDSTNGHVGN